jgi:hypothetical protein
MPAQFIKGLMKCLSWIRIILLICFFLICCSCFNLYSQPEGFNISRQYQLLKKNSMAFELNFGPGFANRVYVPYYENEIIPGVLFSASVSYTPVDRLKTKLEFGSFLEEWQIFNDYTKPGNEYNNGRGFGILSASYFPSKKPFWFSAGAGFGNYQFNRIKDPVLTQQGTYTSSSICNSGFIIQGGVGYDYTPWDKVKTGISLVASYLFMDDLEFVTGETLANDEGSFFIGITVSIGLIIDFQREMSSGR